jgi:capsular polysaccharide biosynthesis protein
VSRRDAGWRHIVNEEEVERLLAEFGFETVSCGSMPVEAQMTLFNRADAVIGVHGGGLTNLIFSEPGTQVLEIFGTEAAQGVSNYRVVCSRLGMPYGRFLAGSVDTGAGREPHDLDLKVDCDHLRTALKALRL